MSVSGCGANGHVSYLCLVDRPIYLPPDDKLKIDDKLIIDIIIHNETWEKLCSTSYVK